jgi:CspA family cold shock protein
VKFFKAEKGWGGIESDEAPGDVWFHYSDIEGTSYRVPSAGEAVEFDYEPAVQDSWRFVATRVRRLTST